MLIAFAFTLLVAIFVHADPDPTNPGPGDVFIEGQNCDIGWKVDTTGLWKDMTISLMTGSNTGMVILTTVATVDGTDARKTTFSFPCPQVTPHSPIYFYQFTSSPSTDKTWTGRFTITDSANNIVPPTENTQPDGEKIPWGTGQLVNTTSTSAAPTSYTPSTSVASSTPYATSVNRSIDSSTSTASTSIASPPPSATAQATANSGLSLSAQSLGWKTALTLGVSALGFALVL